MKNRTEVSYTAQLMDTGVLRIAQKIGEECVEVALAAAKGDHTEIVNEAADLLFHVLVLLKHQGLVFAAVAKQLASRNRG